ncbi:Uncharacterised protein [Grimontia hollisae]|uniref:Uncharacterized protein n=2 Tax=Grimontia hollisae TaxID=673 RepID=D0I8B0_GRIHO|nr:hypothetical protein VHA_001985 [Grimontia hollisae CIP 101886]STO56198.1 Uncharacterised protein [Grimontia hollisae]
MRSVMKEKRREAKILLHAFFHCDMFNRTVKAHRQGDF